MEPFDLREWPGFVEAGGCLDRPALVDEIAIHTDAVSGSCSSLFIALEGQRTDGHRFVKTAAERGASYAIVKRGVPLEHRSNIALLRVADPLQALQELARAYRLTQRAAVVAITGSYGKTMTKDLLFHLIRHRYRTMHSPESFNSQLGVALSLLKIEKQHEVALIEAGISKPGEMDRLAWMIQPTHAILTSIGDAHLTTMGSRETILAEKAKLLGAVADTGFILVPADIRKGASSRWISLNDPRLPQLSLSGNSRSVYTIHFPDGRHAAFRLKRTYSESRQVLSPGIAAAWLLGASDKEIVEGITSYLPEPMRLELWTSPSGATVINDCYSADMLSIRSALDFVGRMPKKGPRLFVFGGFAAASTRNDYRALENCLLKAGVDETLLVDEAAEFSLKTARACPTRELALNALRAAVDSQPTILIKGPKRQSLEQLRMEYAEGIGESRLEISLEAMRHNLSLLATRLPQGDGGEIMAMLKADGYGAGSVQLAYCLKRLGIRRLGLAHVAEAVRLRQAGIDQSLFVFAAAPYEATQAAHWDLEVGVSDLQLAQVLNEAGIKNRRPVKVHLHVDTGMTRLGCRPEDCLKIADYIAEAPGLELHAIFSHLASADEPAKDAFTTQQIEVFSAAVTALETQGHRFAFRHLLGSSGLFRFDAPRCNMARIGLALFGLCASPAVRQCAVDLRPALRLTSRIAAIHTCRKGDRVSYGGDYVVGRDGTRIGVIPLGYFDGLRRGFSGRVAVTVREETAPIVGTICMDFLMVDLTDVKDAEVNDQVVFFGEAIDEPAPTAEEFAIGAGINVYELITSLGPRIQRIYTFEGEARDLLIHTSLKTGVGS